jgi:transposase
VIDASKNLNDNKVFERAISASKSGKVFVFDKGFNSFSILRKIMKENKHFITRWKKNYRFQVLYRRKINPNEKLEGDWILERDEIVLLGTNSERNSLKVRKITCRNTKDNSTFIVMTDDRNLAANKVVTMYVYRWPIEVMFRHIKTNLNIYHFPSHDPQGVRNWILFVMLSVLFIQLMTLDGRSDYTISLMARKSRFKPLIRETQRKIDEWIIIAITEKVE